VDALGGAPGVNSARYGGEPRSDLRNNQKLLVEMSAHDNRGAHYECVLVLMRGPGDTQPLVAQAQWHGEIARLPRGGGGFGYDPLFLPRGMARTAAELAPEEKNRISHRGQALATLLELLKHEP
jgi:XTP/dITP diphosphohydrolase